MELSVSQTEAMPIAYPSLGDRIQSSFIDGMLIIMFMFAFSSILDKFENAPDWIRIAMFFALWAIYEPLCTTMGFTLGNYVKKIRVRSIDDQNKRINILQAIVRYLLKISLGWISFLTIHANDKRRAIHDLLAGTVMIKLPGDHPLQNL